MAYYNGKKLLQAVSVEYLTPRNQIKLTENGSYDVQAYKKAVVAVFPSGTIQTIEDEGVAQGAGVFPSTILPKGLINYVGGMSQKVNQYVGNLVDTKTISGVTFTNNNDGSMTLNGTATQRIGDPNATGERLTAEMKFHRDGHKNLISLGISSAISGFGFGVQGYNIQNTKDYIYTFGSAGDWRNTLSCVIEQGTVLNNLRIYPRVVDLTERYGAGNEPSSTDDPRIKWLIHYLIKNPQYNEGSIVNAPVEKLSSKGFNIWNEEWELGGIDADSGERVASTDRIRNKYPIKVFPNTTYYKNNNTEQIQIFGYDEDMHYVGVVMATAGATTFTTPSNCHYINFRSTAGATTTYNNDICINLSGAMNGTYLPYQAPSEYPIPAEVKALDGYGLGIDSTLFNKTDLALKKFVKKVGVVVDLGALNWYRLEYAGRYVFYAENPSQKNNTTNYLCAKYSTTKKSISEIGDKEITGLGGSGTSIWVRDDSYSSPSDFKTAVNGLTLIYELAEPVETDISEYLDRDFPNEDLIDTYQGGEVEFENDNDMGVPYSLTYQYQVE